MYQDIHYQTESGIAILTLNRPKVMNAIRIQTYHDIIAALQSAEADSFVKVIIMTGAEGRFSAGNDLGDLADNSQFAVLNQCVIDIFACMASLTKPFILAQEGVAVGIGCNFLLHCDFAYAGKSIRYSLPFAKIGVTSEGACSVLLAEVIGQKRANDLLYTGRFFSAEEAEKWGLITAQVEDGQALSQALTTAQNLLKNSQDSIRAIKKLGKAEGHVERVNRAVKNELDLFTELLHTPETQMRIAAVLKNK
jgi:enoyl-CoA hydratase/carnithine racemase